MTYLEATAYLFGLRRFGWRPGLDTTRRLLDLLGNPQASLPCLHIAGTNGKGSTAAMLAAICRTAGLRTGLYTSPHLASFTERIHVNGTPIGEAEIASLTDRLRELCAAHFAPEPTEPPAGQLPHPTFFELTTAMALVHFQQQKVDAAVIEVGLGGRLDATNVIHPRVAAITNITLEHEEYLGRTPAAIAGEKAGIIKPGVPVVTGASGEALEVIRRAAEKRQAPLTVLNEAYRWTVWHSGLDGQVIDLEGPAGRYEALRIRLAGRHQVENAVLAVALAEQARGRGLALSGQAIRDGLAQAAWPGRLQLIAGRPRILLDGAHNPAGARALAAFVGEHREELRDIVLVFGVLKDKDWGAMLDRLAPLARAIVLTHPPSARGLDPQALAAAAGRWRSPAVVPEPAAALALAKTLARPDDTILVTGSLYTVGALLQALGAIETGERSFAA
jgi:dihydrofolate synthase / folylpolyglutamate synthase